ncbi:flavin reductase family protein [Streptomyces sp. NPDC002896]|uniref:flavin reductase family protein n=1 Tax=Streptomyces sp. NPDC002896 TaxID=3154438 RepID=UPI0033326683
MPHLHAKEEAVPDPSAAPMIQAVPQLDPVDPSNTSALRRVYGAFPSGLTTLAALVDGSPVGMVASSFTSVSVDPPLVSVCIQLTSSTWPRLRDRSVIGLSVLAAGQERQCRSLAGREQHRFDDVDWSADEDGAVYIAGSVAWMECTVHEIVRAGDHDIVLLRMQAARLNGPAPLVFHGSAFHALAATA